MNRKHKLFYVFSSFIVGLFVGIAGVSSPTHLSKRNLPVSVKPVNVTTEDATFSHTYTEKVMHDSMYTFVYTIATDQQNKGIRIHVSTPGAQKDFPVFFVVKERKSVMSWQVPFVVENAYDYYNISRTLCPTTIYQNTTDIGGELTIDVSTLSPDWVTFTLMTEIIDMTLSLNTPTSVTVSPSQPQFYFFSFPEGVHSLLVKMASSDLICMVFSIQETTCPIYDLTRNVEFTGSYQTVDQKGAITVERGWFENDEFFVVLVVKPHNLDCTGIESIEKPGKSRKKTVTLRIEPEISANQFIMAVSLAAAWFFMFYVVALIISCIYHYRQTKEGQKAPSRDITQETRPLEPMAGESGMGEHRNLLSGSPGSVDEEAEGSTQTGGYGAIASSSHTGQDSVYDKTNGIPHRIPPPDEQGSDGSEMGDVDMLHDIDREKDVFRTKTFLYVQDLARKPRKVLAKKYRLYPWNIIVIAIFYGLPVIQLVITYQKVLNVTGNEDICYYNFECAHRLGVLSTFNTIYSNIGYVMLGILFLILVYRRDMYHQKLVEQHDRYEKHYGIPQHFGLFYAMGIALVMEGVLSACYHVCPSYSNFQFDTSFMYMIAWLCMLKIYQNRHPDINAQAHVAYFAISVVIFLAVLGVFINTGYFMWVFSGIQLCTCILLSLRVYYMGRYKLDLGVFKRIYLLIKTDRSHCFRPLYVDRLVLLVIGNLANWSIAIYGIIVQPTDFASYLLAIFMINLLMYFAFYIIMKIRSKETIKVLPLMYIILAAIVWGGAAYFFFARITSWQLMPAKSRDGNRKCMLFDFFDSHDVWHFLSAMSMFFGFMVLLSLDDDLQFVPRDRIPVF